MRDYTVYLTTNNEIIHVHADNMELEVQITQGTAVAHYNFFLRYEGEKSTSIASFPMQYVKYIIS